jgi:hypothetical protein
MRCVAIVVWAFDASAKFTRPAADVTAIGTAFCETGKQNGSRYAAAPMNSAENRLLFTFSVHLDEFQQLIRNRFKGDIVVKLV